MKIVSLLVRHLQLIENDLLFILLTSLKSPNIEVINEEVAKIDLDEITVIASGPLTSSKLSIEISSY